MATADGSTVVISCIMPASGSSGARQTDVAPDLPMGRRVASTAAPCSGLAVLRLAKASCPVGSQAENTNVVVSPSGVKRTAKLSLLRNRDTPRKLADLDRLDDLKICDVEIGSASC